MSVFYLDDSLLIGADYDSCVRNVEATLGVFRNAGFFVNEQKSVLIPSKEIKNFCFLINSENKIITLPANKKRDIYNTCIVLLSTTSIFIRVLASFVGTLVASFPAVQYGPLFYRHLEMNKIQALKLNNGNFDSCLRLSDQSKSDITWWKDNVMDSSKYCST